MTRPTGHDPTRHDLTHGVGSWELQNVAGRVGSSHCFNITGRVGSGQEVLKYRGSDRVGSRGFKISRAGSGRIVKVLEGYWFV